MEVLDMSMQTGMRKTMFKIAEEKRNYFQNLKNTLVQNYRSRSKLSSLYNEKKNDVMTFYTSLKMQMMKRSKN